MPNRFFPLAVESFAKKEIDWLGDTIKIMATSGYVFSTATQFLGDISAGQRIAASAALTGKTTNSPTPGILDATDPPAGIVLAALAPVIDGLVVYQDTGAVGTSRVILFDDGKITVTANAAAIITATTVNVEPLVAALPSTTAVVSCSARHPEGKWYPIREFVRDRGGFNALYARPSR